MRMTSAQTSLEKLRASNRRARAIWVDKDGRRHFRYTVVAIAESPANYYHPDGRKLYRCYIKDTKSGTLFRPGFRGHWYTPQGMWIRMLTRAPFNHRAFATELSIVTSFLDDTAKAKWLPFDSLMASWPINPISCTLNLQDPRRAAMISEILLAVLEKAGPSVVYSHRLRSPSCLDATQVNKLLRKVKNVEFRRIDNRGNYTTGYGDHTLAGLKDDPRWATAAQDYIHEMRLKRSLAMKKAWAERRAREETG